jgi:tripartite-type tricarboxylate transporter receptor subunit TctC
VLVVNTRTMPVDGVVGLVEALKRRPGEINFAMTAPGGSAHMMTELFRIRTGTDLVTVPYKGAPDMARGIVSGEVHANFNNLSNILPQIQSGSVRAIAVTSQAQSPLLPGVRTMLEQGITDFEAIAWTALFAPRGTPKAITDKLATALASLRNVPGLAERVRAQGGQLELSDAMTLRKRVGSDIEKWRTVAQKARITAE